MQGPEGQIVIVRVSAGLQEPRQRLELLRGRRRPEQEDAGEQGHQGGRVPHEPSQRRTPSPREGDAVHGAARLVVAVEEAPAPEQPLQACGVRPARQAHQESWGAEDVL